MPLVVLIVVGALAYRNTTTLENNSGMVAHTYEVLGGLEAITSTIKDAETGQRGYLITGKDSYLAPYDAAKQNITATIDHVAQLTSDNASQQERIAQLRPLVQAKFDELADTIELRRDKGFGASIREIANSTSDASQAGNEAVTVAKEASRTVSDLGNSSAEISNVVAFINSIAEQTNLLALNATIEAARAGESGKGFAVVASEVKELAQETARATEDISKRVQDIQLGANATSDAIRRVSEIVTRVNEYQLTIASAVEEQTATTSEMARNVNDASSGSRTISHNLAKVSTAVNDTSSAIETSEQSITELARMSSTLQQLVGQFKY